MVGIFDVLSDDEVRQIGALVEKMEKSRFDFLQLDVGGVKLTIGKGDTLSVVAASETPGATVGPVASPAGPVVPPSPPVPPTHAEKKPTAVSLPADDGSVAIIAPMMGRFYAKPEPDAMPFVTVGAEVSAASTVGLIEVMKVFTAVGSGQSGVISEICAQDAQFVEYGQVLFRVRPKA